MNRTRFYEIIVAHEKGEDLSQFVPKNPAEAALIANLQGGSGSSGGGMVEHPYNNPDLPKLYYGMNVYGKKMYVDMVKFGQYMSNLGRVDLTQRIGDIGSSTISWHVCRLDAIVAYSPGIPPCGDYFLITLDGASPGGILGGLTPSGYTSMTIEQLFETLGVVEYDPIHILEENMEYPERLTGCVILTYVNGDVNGLNLNENPIDWLWFE